MNLLLVQSFAGSLKRWEEYGLLSREMELYVRYIEHGFVNRLFIFSYDSADHDVLRRMPFDAATKARITLLCPARALSGTLARLGYSIFGALAAPELKGVDWVKTNQISGSWAALLLKVFRRKRLLARCGFIWSSNLYARREIAKFLGAIVLEAALFNAADRVSVTTERARRRAARFCLKRRKIFVAPTYVDTELFSPAVLPPASSAVIFVGRFETYKNVVNLVKACGIAGVDLHLIGSGPMEGEILATARKRNVRVHLEGRMPNERIAERLKAFRYYAIPSLYEGLPKSLIEAMSAGLVCIGTNVSGVNDLIEDGVTGYLAAGTDQASIAAAITRAWEANDGERIAANARRHILARHSIDTYLRRELDAMQAMTPSKG